MCTNNENNISTDICYPRLKNIISGYHVKQESISGLDGILFSDTVGFISDLPTHLVESFRATLDELKYADLLIHVIDISDPDYHFKISQVAKILEKLRISHIKQIKVRKETWVCLQIIS